ncbi:MAG TPA: AAA family ATPase [Vitreimonas sp.]|nr:AAA family ATPase [Vitreimonas sp.]
MNTVLSLSKLEFNEQFSQALEILEKSTQHVFITGRAGTGKSTLLSYFRQQTQQAYVVAAPTGVAALNVQGETIHSLFKFWPNITVAEAKKQAYKAHKKRELFQNLQILVIDEISMVRADLMDAMDIFLQTIRANDTPFGGVRLIAFGDLYQLPPVLNREEEIAFSLIYPSPYFFDSEVFQRLLQMQPSPLTVIELQTIYRQSEQEFIEVLNGIRDKTLTSEQLNILNRRVNDEWAEHLDTAIVLTATNYQAEHINTRQLQALDAEPWFYQGSITGSFDKPSFPTDEVITLKPGARVMMVNNDADKRWVNGSMGRVVKFQPKPDNPAATLVIVKLDSGEEVEVAPYSWEISQSIYNQETNTIEREVIGSFSQYPLRLAWAVTIHKSQGKTFTKVIVDLGRQAFAAGQTYVALSRCTSLGGLHLVRPLRDNDIQLDSRILSFLKTLK